MYFLVGIPGLLKAYAGTAALVALVAFFVSTSALSQLPISPSDWYTAVSGAVGKGLLVSGVVASLGQTPLFPWVCRVTPLGRLFPCIDGEWNGQLESNIITIAERDPELKGKVSPQPTEAVVVIKARLLTL